MKDAAKASPKSDLTYRCRSTTRSFTLRSPTGRERVDAQRAPNSASPTLDATLSSGTARDANPPPSIVDVLLHFKFADAITNTDEQHSLGRRKLIGVQPRGRDCSTRAAAHRSSTDLGPCSIAEQNPSTRISKSGNTTPTPTREVFRFNISATKAGHLHLFLFGTLAREKAPLEGVVQFGKPNSGSRTRARA